VIFAVRDVTDEKRRSVLERVFYHDVLNTAGMLRSLSEMLPQCESHEREEFQRDILSLSEQLLEEIQAQRDLVAAERGDLEVNRRSFSIADLLGSIVSQYRRHSLARGKAISLHLPEECESIQSDPALVRRVLGNLLKNALEATEAGGRVAVELRCGDVPTFCVRNPGIMPDEVKHQIFKRSFSTKGGHGRGIGTYSVKLLVERYLGGEVWFSSDEDEGTAFSFRLSSATSEL
jgi:signal transduction histidine kinase